MGGFCLWMRGGEREDGGRAEGGWREDGGRREERKVREGKEKQDLWPLTSHGNVINDRINYFLRFVNMQR